LEHTEEGILDYSLEVSFDIQASFIKGTATIPVKRGQEVKLHRGSDLVEVSIDGQKTAVSGGVALFLAIASLLRPARLEPALPGKADMERARAILKASRRIYSNLALLGDKALLFSENQTAFIMYGVEGRSWVAFGDPIGPEEEWTELAWRFHEMSERHDGWTVFHEVGRGDPHLYLDLGLTLLKIGEEARIPLETFSLEGSNRRGLRHSHHQVEKEGCIFKIILPADIPSILPDVKTISDAWLAEKNTREKKFSMGFFN
jgi:phosphatidylglycerol lysyltransferase